MYCACVFHSLKLLIFVVLRTHLSGYTRLFPPCKDPSHSPCPPIPSPWQPLTALHLSNFISTMLYKMGMPFWKWLCSFSVTWSAFHKHDFLGNPDNSPIKVELVYACYCRGNELREVQWFAQGHTACRWISSCWNVSRKDPISGLWVAFTPDLHSWGWGGCETLPGRTFKWLLSLALRLSSFSKVLTCSAAVIWEPLLSPEWLGK